MLQQRSIIALGFAILLGLVAVYLANVYLTGAQPEQVENAPQGTTKVAVARVPLEFGTEITPDKVRFVDLPQSAIPQGTYYSIPMLLPMNKRRVALRAIGVNEPILKSNISGEGGRASITSVLRPDMRAAAVRISDVSSAGGFILPGDTVDVLVTRSAEGGGGATQIADVLLQNVRVLAVDLNANNSTEQPAVAKTATLEVSQINAQKLALAQTVGQIVLALRNTGDETNPVVETVGVEDLRDGAYGGGYRSPGPAYRPAPAAPRMAAYTPGRAPARPTPTPKPEATVQVFRGVAGSVYEVRRNARW